MRAPTILCIMLLATTARAVEPADPSGVPPPILPSVPPSPPPEPPEWLLPHATDLTLADAAALERHGYRTMRGGAALVGVGGGLALVGVSLLIIASSWDDGCWGHDQVLYSAAVRSSAAVVHTHDGYCNDDVFAFAGATTMIVGIGLVVAGASVATAGEDDVAIARRARHRCSLSLRPKVGRDGGGIVLTLTP